MNSSTPDPDSLPLSPREDLILSGLDASTISRMRIRERSAESKSRLGIPLIHIAYDIPYFSLNGDPIPFYRIKIIPALSSGAKYLQPRASETHAYLPPYLKDSPTHSLWLDPTHPIVITEGEKKATKACQEGILCIGLGGVNSWRRKILEFDITNAKRSLISPGKGSINADSLSPADSSEGLSIIEEFVQIPWEDRKVFICFDSDTSSNPHVQLAAFELASWLESEGAIPRQILIPSPDDFIDIPPDSSLSLSGKIGLDDFLIHKSSASFWALPTILTQHPHPKALIRKSLNTYRLKRSASLKCSGAILNNLDSNGKRYTSSSGSYYYWDSSSHILHGFQLDDLKSLRHTSFGAMLHERFGVGTSDTHLLSRIADDYVARPTITSILPKRVSYATSGPSNNADSSNTDPGALYIQLSDSYLLKITSDFIEVCDNGTDDILFLSGAVEPIPVHDILYTPPPSAGGMPAVFSAPFTAPRWLTTLAGINLQPFPFLSLEESQVLIAGLFYLNPWFRHWQGLMLPLELTIGEAGSGKSFLYNLRQSILTGRPSLNNPPMSHKDWSTQLINSSAMWVCDNFSQPPHDLRENMSDELARLITDPNPKIEMRKLYTTAELGTYPVDCSFAVTSIRNPFHKNDLMQRSLIISLNAIQEGSRDSRWYMRQMECGGRVQWILEQARMAQRFLQICRESWNPNYLATNRLVHLEQSLLLMGRAMGTPEAMTSAVSKLTEIINSQVVGGDPVMEALRSFAAERLCNHSPDSSGSPFKVTEIINWAQLDPDSRFDFVRTLKNPIALGKYIAQHQHAIKSITGISVSSTRRNQVLYTITPLEESLEDL